MKAGDVVGELRLHHSYLVGVKSRRYWVCRCSCGKIVKARQDALSSGATRSCGHLQLAYALSGAARRSHGMCGSPEWNSYQHMLARCYRENCKDYPNYGGRGIVVCERWRRSFSAFLEDMGERPTPSHSIGRKDNDAGYSPSNCEWQTKEQQNRNTRRTRFVEVAGSLFTLPEASRILGVSYSALKSRLRRSGYSLSF